MVVQTGGFVWPGMQLRRYSTGDNLGSLGWKPRAVLPGDFASVSLVTSTCSGAALGP